MATGDARRSMILGALGLLARRGLQATSFSEVLAATGAPRGSIYHHFPQGKDQLVDEALRVAADHALALMEEVRGGTPVAVTERFLAMWRDLLTRSELQAGCAVVAVTVATDSADLLDTAAATFRRWRALLADLLTAGGASAEEAGRFAAVLLAASEGAVVLARAERSLAPFDLVAEDLLARAALLA